MTTTHIKNASWVVAWDEQTDGHKYLRNIDVAFSDDRIVHVGPGYTGTADRVIDGSRVCVCPGFVNTHSHLMAESLGRGIIEELGNPALYMSGLYDVKAAFLASHHMSDGGGEGRAQLARVSTRLAVGELLKSGVTTVVDLSLVYDGWHETLAETGIRAYVAPMYRQARWRVPTGWRLEYEWDEAKGVRDFETALDNVDAARRNSSGRLDGVVAPAQIDTCTVDLFQDSVAAAKERGMKLTTHCAQSVVEFTEITRRHGMTPVQWADSIGLLSPDAILGHGIFLDQHSWTRWHTKTDLSILARCGCSVAHCPLVFSRYGQMMECVGTYVRAGVNVCMGTDTEPHNMVEEIRMATTLGRISARDIRAIELAEIYHAATIGGAKALGRNDLGRLRPGAKADILLLDLDCPAMMPVRDPIRSLVYSAADRAIRDVFVDGRQVVEAGIVLTIDLLASGREAEKAQASVAKNVSKVDDLKRSAEEISPLTLALG